MITCYVDAPIIVGLDVQNCVLYDDYVMPFSTGFQ